MDIVSACEEIGDVKRKLASLNQEDFRLIYDNAKLLAAEHRISVRASRCSVTEIENEEQIYEKMYSTLFVPFVRSLKEGMDTRFSSIIYKAANINRLIPIYLHGTECDVGMFRAVAELYATDISQETFLLEVPRWHRRWNTEISGKQSIVDFPHDLKTTLNHCNPNLFPNIFKLLKIFWTLPITTATVERSFSNLRRLKSYLRSTVVQDRLSGLALINIHSDIDIPSEKIVEEFFRKNRRNIKAST
ncbi:52 kDa repressor of the inhibitor of the protein kinase-like [Ciona intestinalis]